MKPRVCDRCANWVPLPVIGLCREKLKEEKVPKSPIPELDDWCSAFRIRGITIRFQIVSDPSAPRMPEWVIEELKKIDKGE